MVWWGKEEGGGELLLRFPTIRKGVYEHELVVVVVVQALVEEDWPC